MVVLEGIVTIKDSVRKIKVWTNGNKIEIPRSFKKTDRTEVEDYEG